MDRINRDNETKEKSDLHSDQSIQCDKNIDYSHSSAKYCRQLSMNYPSKLTSNMNLQAIIDQENILTAKQQDLKTNAQKCDSHPNLSKTNKIRTHPMTNCLLMI